MTQLNPDGEPTCPLCGDDPKDPTLHADSCPTVVKNLCGIIQNGGICMLPEHMPREGHRTNVDWDRWREEHVYTPVEDVVVPE